jgi:predicted GIY-YIG superfamily endonuclease
VNRYECEDCPAVASAESLITTKFEKTWGLEFISKHELRRRANFYTFKQGDAIVKYVYILQSVKFPDRYYVGLTSNLKLRLREHNSGKSIHTSKYLPWSLKVFIGFQNEQKAFEFEKYLKSSSGRAFAKRHF